MEPTSLRFPAIQREEATDHGHHRVVHDGDEDDHGGGGTGSRPHGETGTVDGVVIVDVNEIILYFDFPDAGLLDGSTFIISYKQD